MDAVTRKRLEFDRIVACAATFSLSDMGRDALASTAPILHRAELLPWLERVRELCNFLHEGEALPFSRLPDTRGIMTRLELRESCLEPQELLDVHDLLDASSKLRTFVYRHRSVYPELYSLVSGLWLEKSLQYEISRIVDEEARIRDTASDGLQVIRHDLREGRGLLRRRMERILKRCREHGWLMEDTVALKHGRLVLGLRVEYKHKLQGYIQDYSQSGQTVFIEPAEVLELNNRLQDLELDERREIERILREVTGRVRAEYENVLHNQELMACFDALYGKACFARETSSVLPALDTGRRLSIRNGYHPWLLWSHRGQQRAVYPLDLELGADEQVLCISGPNAGGKSVAMKTVGLLSCMLQHGFLVPCSESSVFPLFDDIFIGIGDEQSIENDLSTFSSHLVEIRRILHGATAASLVLIDELCSGTDVGEGSAIARAVIERILRIGAKAVVTTHLGELKAYAHERQGVVNGAMDFDNSSLSPTFRFQKGLPGNSFAFAMLRRLGFDDELIAEASSHLGSVGVAMERMLDELREQLLHNRELESDLRKAQQQLAGQREALLKEREEFERGRREAQRSAARDVQKEVEYARKEIRSILREAKAVPGGRGVEDARRKLERVKREAWQKEAGIAGDIPAAVPDVQAGDLVTIVSTSTTGEVVQVQGDEVVVQCGNFRLTTSPSNLQKTSRKQSRRDERKQAGSAGWSAAHGSLDSTRLDLRGMSGDEAIGEVERLIDRMRLQRIGTATIIHGKGTGALRLRVIAFLKEHPAVQGFRLGEWGEGGAGVTVVEL
ncbi:endonuclease MutS2 [Prosthecochloris sp. CIB 2401]|uniref:endonuclease MutS2 n=1 Tax=Prosthecochloris sp. CIB 2401 TaxID=1868325 RepID=UPI00080AAD99|nr:Smr/MutS family protein [Prosthecochloris sp. CIB 2401]ANT64282.1 MutS2 protein [Prosthecochloris sp. CIB 2401]